MFRSHQQPRLGGMKNMIKWLLFFLISASTAFGQQVVEGTIIDKETRLPIPFASIGILGLPKGTSTNIDGVFSLVIPDSSAIKVTCLGYKCLRA
jgi:hypothetical protein